MPKTWLFLFAIFLPAVCLAGSATTPSGDVIMWPDQVWTLPFLPYSIPIQIVPSPTGGSDVAAISVSGAGAMSPSGFISLSGGTNNVTVKGTGLAIGTTMAGFSVITGITGGADNPPVTFNVAVNSTPPTDDKTAANQAGEPVSTATGELYKAFSSDFSLGGPLNLEFRRYYASLLTANRPPTNMGTNWTHNFDWLLIVNGSQAQLFRFGGRSIQFAKATSGWQLVNAEQYGYQLINNASGFQFLDPRTNLIYGFNGTGGSLALSSVQDRNGNTLTLTQMTGATVIADGLGRTLTLTLDPTSKNIVKVTDQTGRAISFGYTSGNLTQMTDANGNVTTFGYSGGGGLMSSETRPAGNTPLTQTFDSSSRVATQVDSRGNSLTFNYSNNTTAYSDPLGATSTDTFRNLTDALSYADPDNQTISIAYDGNDRRTSVTDRLGNKSTLTYDPVTGYLTSETTPSGNKTSYTYTPQPSGGFTFYKMSQVQYPDGTSTSFSYDANGNATSITDQAGKIWKFTYNSHGQIASVADPTGRICKYAYNPDATVASVTDAAGNVTAYSYDMQKRVSQIKFADSSTRAFSYDNLDNVLKTTDERGNSLAFVFDANGRPQSVTDPSGGTRTMTYNNDDQLSKQTDRTGQTASMSYDKNGLISSVTSPAGETHTFTYDSHHRTTSVVDSAGHGISFGYNKEDGLTSLGDGLSRKTSFTLDGLGFPSQITTPLNESYTLTRNPFGVLTGVTDPTGMSTKVTYDARGLLASMSAGSLTASYTYDDSGLIAGATDPNGNGWIIGRDSGGRFGSLTDPLQRATKYTYDQRNRFATQQTPLGTVNFTFDAAGNLVRRQYSDGTDLQYTFDKNDRLTAAPGLALGYDAESQITASNGIQIVRDADGRIASITLAPNKTVKYAYSPVGLLATITDWAGGTTTFTYDAANQLTAVTRPNKLGTQYAYDADGRLTGITEDAGATITLQRDAAGRIVSETRSQIPAPAPGVSSQTFDAANQVSAFTYDAMGRLTADGVRTYAWDMASRLTSYSGADGTGMATYDAMGMRTSATSNAGTLNYVSGTTEPTFLRLPLYGMRARIRLIMSACPVAPFSTPSMLPAGPEVSITSTQSVPLRCSPTMPGR
jgi:YD repeat-containing protein